MQIIIEPAKVLNINVNNINIIEVNDSFNDFKISVRIDGMYRSILLWSGEVEYAQAGNWDSEDIKNRITELSTLSAITFC